MTKLQDFLNSAITDVVGMNRVPKQGDLFGIELECEGKKVDYDGDGEILKYWTPHADGSLRANHGSACEWVFNGPVFYDPALGRINKLFDYFETNKAKLVTSNRTSTHVHFNMGDKNVYQLVNMFILFTILEDILDSYCGEDRKGNLFCLSSRYAEEQLQWLEGACFRDFCFKFRENWRYCSFNMASLAKFGTVEFRGMRGLDNRQDVINWLGILNEFCEYACYKMKNPVDIVQNISMKEPREFLSMIFSKANVDKLTAGLSDQMISASLYEGLRLVQMLCYRVGTEFDQVKLRGKDFWASFSKDKDPELDIDPADFGGIKRKGRGRAGVNPFGEVPPARPQDAFAQEIARQRAAAIAARQQEIVPPPQPRPQLNPGWQWVVGENRWEDNPFGVRNAPLPDEQQQEEQPLADGDDVAF